MPPLGPPGGHLQVTRPGLELLDLCDGILVGGHFERGHLIGVEPQLHGLIPRLNREAVLPSSQVSLRLVEYFAAVGLSMTAISRSSTAS